MELIEGTVPVEVYRSTGERSLLSNLAKPLTKYSSAPCAKNEGCHDIGIIQMPEL